MSETVSAKTTAQTVTLSLPLLKRGSDDSGHVLRLQEMLNVYISGAEEGGHGHPLALDGVFGAQTEQGVKIFQGFDGDLIVDGQVGAKTWTKLLTAWLSGSVPG